MGLRVVESFSAKALSNLVSMQNCEPRKQAIRDEDDLQSVDRVPAGDRRAFEALVRRHERRVFRVTLAILGNTEDAEEAMQDAFLKAFRHLGQFRRDARFTTWLTRIAVNAAIEKRKTRKNFLPLSESENANEPFLPKNYEPWKSNPEQIFGEQEIHRLVEDRGLRRLSWHGRASADGRGPLDVPTRGGFELEGRAELFRPGIVLDHQEWDPIERLAGFCKC